MNNEPMECPKCGFISLKHFNTETDTSVGTFEEWRCKCGHYQTMDVAKPEMFQFRTEPQTQAESGFDTFVHELGFDKIDLFGKVEAMKLAFDAGRGFEAERTTKQLKEMNKSLEELVKLPMAKRQA